MKHIFLILFFAGTLSAYAQKSALIKGQWKFKEVVDKSKLDSTTLAQANVVFASWEMTFAPDGKYFYRSLEIGTWALNKEETKVVITSKGKTNEWDIKGLTDKEVKLNMGKAVIAFDRPAPKTTPPASASKALPPAAENKGTEITPFEVVQYVRTGSVKELLTYCEKFGIKYAASPKEGKTEYKVSGLFECGPETIIDSKSGSLAVTYKFKDRKQKSDYIARLKEEGFAAKATSSASATLIKDGVEVWMTMMGDTWIISKAGQ